MSQVFTPEGRRRLRASWLLVGAALVAGVVIIAGTQGLLQRELSDGVASSRRLSEARSRVESARRERDNFQESADVFAKLTQRGLLKPESRLDLVERVNALRARHKLAALDYEIAPQRPLTLAGGQAFGAIDVLASRVKVHARALHEGDAIAFVDEISRNPQGIHPVDRCLFRRIELPSGAESLAPRIEVDCSLEWITVREKRGSRG